MNMFAKFWMGCNYNDSANLIYSTKDETEKRIKKDENTFLFIDGLNLFREGIKPTWEDAANNKGYHFQAELDVSPNTIDILTKTYED